MPPPKKKAGNGAAKVLLRKEFLSNMRKPKSEFFIVHGLVDDNIQEWEIYVIGPPGTHYENGIYKAHLAFPDDYPIRPPVMRFKAEIFHPNIYKDGKVCISTLQSGDGAKDSSVYWRPVLGVEQAVLSVISLFSDPNVSDPANSKAAGMYSNDEKAYSRKCQELAGKSLKLLPEGFKKPVIVHDSPEESKEQKVLRATHVDPFSNGQGNDLKSDLDLVGSAPESGDEDEEFYYDPDELSENGYNPTEPSESKILRKKEEEKRKSKRDLPEHEDFKGGEKRDDDRDDGFGGGKGDGSTGRRFGRSSMRNVSIKRNNPTQFGFSGSSTTDAEEVSEALHLSYGENKQRRGKNKEFDLQMKGQSKLKRRSILGLFSKRKVSNSQNSYASASEVLWQQKPLFPVVPLGKVAELV